jgi:Tfp pilus assembly PilM family ATPase
MNVEPVETIPSEAQPPARTNIPALAAVRNKCSSLLGDQQLNIELGNDYLIWSITKAFSHDLTNVVCGTFNDPRLPEFSVLEEKFLEIVESAGLHNCSVNLFLSIHEALLRSYYVPLVPKEELDQVVKWEGNRVFPFNLDKELLDWRIMGTVEWSGTKKYQIQAAAAPANRIRQVCDLITKRGFSINSITLTASAWESHLRHHGKALGIKTLSSVAIIRLLGNNLSVLCFHKGKLEFVRESMVEMARSGHDYEASLRFVEGGVASDTTDPYLAQSVDPLLVSRSVVDDLDYYYGQFSQRNVEVVLLSCSTKIQPELIESLHTAIGIEIKSVFPEPVVLSHKTLAPYLLLPISLRTFGNRVLNLIPPLYLKAARETRKFRLSLVAAAVVTCVMAVVSATQLIHLRGVNDEMKAVQNSLDNTRNSPAYVSMQNFVNEEAMWQSQSAQMKQQPRLQTKFMKLLSVSMPSDIFLTNLTVESAQGATGSPVAGISITGFVTDQQPHSELSLAAFVKTLYAHPCCKNVQLRNQYTTVSDRGKRLEFNITLEMESCPN